MKKSTYAAVKALMDVDRGISPLQRDAVMAILEGGAPDQTAERDVFELTLCHGSGAGRKERVQAKEFLRRPEAAQYIGCSVRQLDAMKADGDLPFCCLGRRLIVFRVEDLDAFMQRHRIAVREKGSAKGRRRRSGGNSLPKAS